MTARNYLLSLSFANLVYLRAWSDLIPASPHDEYLRKTVAGYPLYLGVATDVLLLSLLTFLVVGLAGKLPGWLRRVLPVLPLGILGMTGRSLLQDSDRAGIWVAAGGAVVLVLAGLAIWFEAEARQAMRVIALASTPCLAVTFAGTPLYLLGQKPLPPDPPLAQRLAGTPPVRVVWVLFDDWDEKLTFEGRAMDVRLPVLDDLSIRSFRGTRALAVETGVRKLYDMGTYEAIPALLYGKFLAGSVPDNASTERLTVLNGKSTPRSLVLGEHGTVFDSMRERGWNSGVAGWYLPYCRLLGSQLTDCWWDMRYIAAYSASQSYRQGAIDETRLLFETSVFSPFGAALVDEKHFGLYQDLLSHGRQLAADASLGLALIHLNVPHAPYFYDPKIGPSFRYGAQGTMYTEALHYLDQALGEILTAVRKSGLEGKTAFIVSSDHPFRYSGSGDTHVPFIVHLPGDDFGVVWNSEFSAIATKDLIVAIASGEVKTASDVQEFVRKYTQHAE